MLITSRFRIFFLKIKFDPENKSLKEFSFTELTEKVNIVRKFISSFVSAQEISKVFVLNPLPYLKQTKNNKKNNVIYILNENLLKKIEFDIQENRVEPDVSTK